MRLADFERLKKLMMSAHSDNDHEALAALRAANKLLAAENRNWQQVLDRVVQLAAPEVEADEDARPSNVDADLATAIEGATGNFRKFLEDLQRQWEEQRWLSPLQKQAIYKAAHR